MRKGFVCDQTPLSLASDSLFSSIFRKNLFCFKAPLCNLSSLAPNEGALSSNALLQTHLRLLRARMYLIKYVVESCHDQVSSPEMVADHITQRSI